ncbi:hypothetical protein P6U16_23860 (plasmid) [Rhizobium sp. 32-5/1]|uniref:hypothetical protein n=1 Tax=Rhizobium sp. 32-5/1 TaxID=3019602 RepID=UPI00240DA037|nr:hypothetical protein [Rhizobium sp. 32-5/1]WEZ85985.1 hypothetical protein P6U16_23860 [Rhizobium sp. 32-5/1]
MKKELAAHITKAAEIGATGNGIIREVSEIDDELKAALQSLEPDRQKRENEKSTSQTQSHDAADANRGTPHGELTQARPDDRDARIQEDPRDAG